MNQNLKQKLRDIFGMDIRSLALLRVGLGLSLLAIWLYRLPDIQAMYSDSGILPREAVLKFSGSPWYVSLNMISGAWQVQAALFLIAIIFSLFLLVGYKTRLSTAISWFLVLSLQNRNLIVLSGADAVIRLLLLWAIFLPLGACFSLDALKRGTSPKSYNVISAATVGFLLQFIAIYFFTSILKSGAAWHSQGNAVYYAMSNRLFAGKWAWLLLGHPAIMRLLTHAVWWVELLGPLLLIFPFFTAPLRVAGVIILAGLQSGIGLFMHLGFFPFNMVLFAVALLPALFWQTAAKLKKDHGKLMVYYDGQCGTCQKLANAIRVFLLVPCLEILPAQTNQAAAALMRKYDSWIVMDQNQKAYLKFDGVIKLLSASYLFWPLALALNNNPVKALGTKMYEYVAGHRKLACELPRPQATATRLSGRTGPVLQAGGAILGSCLIAVILLYNYTSLPNAKLRLPAGLAPTVELLRLDQDWSMFAPYPITEDGWYAVSGNLTGGGSVNVLDPQEKINFSDPDLASMDADVYWQKYFANLPAPGYGAYRPYYAAYLCRSWNQSHPLVQQLINLQLYYVQQPILPQGGYGALQINLPFYYDCSGVNLPPFINRL